MTETKQDKAQRYVTEGRVKPGRRCYYVHADTGVWTVTRRPDKALRCTCPVTAKQECSHRLAVLLYREQMAKSKEEEKTMAADNGTKIVAAQTVAMTPQVAPQEPVGDELEALWNISQRLSKCGMFRTKRKVFNPATRREDWVEEPAPPEDVFMIVLSGRDFGLSAAASSRHLKMIKGALSISAEIMRSRLHQYGYEYSLDLSQETTRYTVSTYSNNERQQTGPAWAEMTLWRRSDPSAKWVVRYETAEAVQAGLTKSEGGWDKNPGDMLVARVTTRAVRRYAPEVLNKTYLPEELGFYESEDGQGGTRLVSVTVDSDANDEPVAAPEAADEQSGATPPPAAKKPRTRKPAAAADAPVQQPKQPAAKPHDPETGEILEGVFEEETDDGGKPQRLTDPEPDPIPEPEVTNLDLDDDEDDIEEGVDDEPAAAPAPPPPVPKPKKTKPTPPPEPVAAPEPEPTPEPETEEVAADQLAYNPDGTPANEATRRWEAENAAPEEPEEEPENPSSEPTQEEYRYFEHAGALRAFLTSKGIKFHDKFKGDLGYGETSWQNLDESDRVVIYMAARDGSS